LEQCVYCQSVYEFEDSDSTFPTALCSKECEEGFKKHEEDIAKEFNY
jgi:hypothetical protein